MIEIKREAYLGKYRKSIGENRNKKGDIILQRALIGGSLLVSNFSLVTHTWVNSDSFRAKGLFLLS